VSVPNEQDGGAESASQPTPANVGELQTALAAAEARAAEQRDLYMRALAEIDNVRKRAARDIEQAHKYALDRFTNDLIGVKDSLETGLTLSADVGALKAGTDATLKLLGKAFERAGIQELVPVGEPFNPELHEAMVTQPSAQHEPNSVLQVVQKGYQLNGRLLRPARVIVAREP
jgi:molecular chaperone GrpE